MNGTNSRIQCQQLSQFVFLTAFQCIEPRVTQSEFVEFLLHVFGNGVFFGEFFLDNVAFIVFVDIDRVDGRHNGRENVGDFNIKFGNAAADSLFLQGDLDVQFIQFVLGKKHHPVLVHDVFLYPVLDPLR